MNSRTVFNQFNCKKRLNLSNIISGIILIFISPIFLILGIAIIIDDGLPIFFKQQRLGVNNTVFSIFKFRTMKNNTPSNKPTHLLKDPDRFNTRLGRYLRKSSFDELPQLINIFLGEMVFIGPRPPLLNQHDLITLRKEKKIEGYKPGITGWAQINGRDEISIAKKVDLELYYVKNKSFLMDLKIIILTFFRVILTKGVLH